MQDPGSSSEQKELKIILKKRVITLAVVEQGILGAARAARHSHKKKTLLEGQQDDDKQRSASRSKGSKNLDYLLKVTHLRLHGKRLTHGLECIPRWCPNVKVLYAYENYFTTASFGHKIEHAFLQENFLSSLQFLENSTGLRYLNVGSNCITEFSWDLNIRSRATEKAKDALDQVASSSVLGGSRKMMVSGESPGSKSRTWSPASPGSPVSPYSPGGFSEALSPVWSPKSKVHTDRLNLEKINISRQRTDQALVLSPDFFRENLSHCLLELAIAANKLQDLNPLQHLTKLQTLDAEDNLVEDIGDIRDMLTYCNALHTLKLEGNPYCNSGPHIWRTAIVVAAPSLNLLNGKEIAYTEKLYHRQIEERKRKRSPPLPG